MEVVGMHGLLAAVLVAGLVAPTSAMHDLSVVDGPQADRLTVRPSAVDPADSVFGDGLGRQVVLRGYAISGSTKLAENGFTPFRSTADAAAAFATLPGSNVIRFQLSWEGVAPTPDTVDTGYLDAIAAQIRAATARGLRVIVEYHSDLMSRHLFRPDSWYTGNGMPKWAVDRLGLTGKEYCGPACVTWGQHLLTDNSGVRPAARAFWNNTAGVQDAFLDQARQALVHLKSALPERDWDRILGFEPINEPFDGGMEGLSSAQWDAQRLWPFHHRVRDLLDETGWRDKLQFAEPNVFWNSQLGPLVPALGSTPDPLHRSGIVFTPHFYDQARQLPLASPPASGAYLPNFDLIRKTARDWHSPALVSEFGAANDHGGATDTAKEITGEYQALNGLADYSPVLSGTQWHWDPYRGRHHEAQNGNPGKIRTTGDAWNDEDFSVIDQQPQLRDQAYPQAAQGDLVAFSSQALATDAAGDRLRWQVLRPGNGRDYFAGTPFALTIWQGRNSEAPTQLHLSSTLDSPNTVVITESGVHRLADLPGDPRQRTDELVRRGDRLYQWTDSPGVARHFQLIVRDPGLSDIELGELQRALSTVVAAGQNPARVFQN
ncbi:glycosyl hydrolase family 5 [Pseudonocardiaceae bacterium YIM PH 21723]|nr:glycosyl hydrolase family 5 [Pseudonocardiaceae bacterium YIM PH 21723]